MPVLEPGIPFSSPEPTLRVENQLPAGTHEFRLVCVDEGGNESDPTALIVTVRQRIPVPDRDPPVFDPADRFEGRLRDRVVIDRVVLGGAGRVVEPVVDRPVRPVGLPGRTIPFRRGGGR